VNDPRSGRVSTFTFQNENRQLLVVNAELEPLISHFRRRRNPPEVALTLERYLRKSHARLEAATTAAGEEPRGCEDSPGVAVNFANDHGVTLAAASWTVRFQPATLDFENKYRVTFTEAGQSAASECHLPDELLQRGFCNDWSAEYCFRQLGRLANVDDTPCEAVAEEAALDNETLPAPSKKRSSSGARGSVGSRGSTKKRGRKS